MEAIRIGDFNDYKITDSEVVKRVLAGEKELYEILLRRNNQKLYRVIRGYLSEDAEIQDIMQSTYLKAFEKLYQFRHGSTYSTWLIRIAINEALVRLKEKGKVMNLLADSTEFKGSTILELPDQNQLNPEKRIIAAESKKLLENSIDSLEPKYRTVYILREVEGMSIKEISDCLSISRSNTKVRLHRAKAMLKEDLYKAIAAPETVFEFGNSKCDLLCDRIVQRVL